PRARRLSQAGKVLDQKFGSCGAAFLSSITSFAAACSMQRSMLTQWLRVQFATCLPENRGGRPVVLQARGLRTTNANRWAPTAPGKFAARPADSEPFRIRAERHDDSVKNSP